MLVMPFNYDQPDNASRAVRLGVGRTLSRRQYSPARAARELARLLADPQYRRAAQAIGRRMQTEQGAQSACDALEHLLARPRRGSAIKPLTFKS
jgi:UDP:flavonoid glycosyltransferase YjiC (YdhE family)